MTLKTAFRILIESEPIVVADEALILLVVNDETLLFSQLGKGINDDAEENVLEPGLKTIIRNYAKSVEGW